jgi:coenzyme PQQ synthesis protein D (PqqD)
MAETGTLEPQTAVVRLDGLRSASVDADLIIMNRAKSNYVGLDEIGRRIWDILATPHRIDELCRQLAAKYAGDPEEIGRDVLGFLNELYAENLITVTADKPSGSAGAD